MRFRTTARRAVFLIVSLAAVAAAPLCPAAKTPILTIADYLARESDPDQSLHTLGVARSEYIDAIYAIGDYAPLWHRPAQIRALLQRIEDAPTHGLVGSDYHLSRLQTFAGDPARDASQSAAFDILLTDALARLAYHLRFGKANPRDLDPHWNYSRALETTDPARWLRDAIVEDRVDQALDWLAPQTPVYAALRQGLARYRTIAAGGEWPVVPPGPTMKPDGSASVERVRALRARLAAEGFDAGGGPGFDPALEQAVRGFQRQHGLTVDGLVGRQTLAALNVPAGARVEQLRVNLERIRWVFREVEPRRLVVNIAAFQAAYIDHGETRWRARAVVGRPYRQTPIFKAAMTHVIANPTWTVPPTIMRKDVLPAMAKDPSYLAHKRLRVLDRRGKEVDPSTIDWQHARAGGFPYVLRQDPGPDNALGRIKFMFPNPHFVYLHDTPSRALFERAERTFSSGCIRVERPLELAGLLLGDNPAWRPETVFARNVPVRFDLDFPVTVMLLYLTAFSDDDGDVQFRRDVYDRDAAILRALDGPFRFSPPRGYRVQQ